MQDLVGPRSSDARDHTLVAQHRVQPTRFAGADLCQALLAESEGLGAQVRELVLRLLGVQEPDTRAFLRAGFGQDEPGATLEDQLEGRCLRTGLTSLEVPEP